MKNWLIKCLVGSSLLAMASPSFAINLWEVYQQSLQSDPTLQGAEATRLSHQEALPQSRAEILPNITASANSNFNRLNTTQITKFNSNGYNLTLTQPLLHFDSWMKIREASAQVKQASAIYAAAEQDLMVRVAKAYFKVLLAEDNLHYTLSQKEAIAHQLDFTKQRYKVGLDTTTSLNEAQASYDTIVAAEIAARNNIVNSKEQLREIAGQPYEALAGISSRLPLVTPQPADAEQWVSSASLNNFNLQASRYAVMAARDKIKQNYAGHLPTVDAVGSYAYNNNGSVKGLQPGNNQATTVGLQLNIPIYQGGLVASQTRQAQADYAKASADLELNYRDIVTKTRQAYNDIIAGISQIKADKQAIVSNESALETTQEAYKIGTRTILDVLTAQQHLYQAQYNYTKDQYNYIVNTLVLKQQAGTLSPTDISMVNTWLQSTKPKASS